MKNPLLFLHQVDHSEYISWEPINKDFNGSIPEAQIIGNEFHFALSVAGPVSNTENEEKLKNDTKCVNH